jgi:cell division protein FtsW
MLISRSDRGILASWWFTVDWLLMSAVLLLMAAGAMFSLAASPPVAARIGLDSFHFFTRQLIFLAPAIAIMVATSFLKPRIVWRVSFAVYVTGLVLMLAAMKFGPEIKGAHRWIDLGPFNLQPSELVKPAFVVSASWLMAQGLARPGLPGVTMAWVLFLAFLGLLALQPDFGQAVLICAVWGVMLLIHGIPWAFVVVLAAIAGAAATLAYFTFSHVASRVDRFISPEKGDTFQVDTATRAFEHGGVFGTGPGGGSAKRILPDAHTDFIFAVVGEEFGLVACAVLIGLVLFVVLRVLRKSMASHDPFAILAMSGLITIFGLQAIINMAVNVSLMPAKGMTLPFISYGGSSMISMAFGIGLILALGRAKPHGTRLPGT